MERLKSLKPYLFTAYYDWLIDNKITPHLLVDAKMPGVRVPVEYVNDGRIILSLLPSAIADYQCISKGISFKARFKGKSEDIFIPFLAMEQLIALESGSALPIGSVLEQLDLAPDDEVYPDEASESPMFKLDDEDGADDDKIPADIKTSEATKIEATTPAKEENKPAFSSVRTWDDHCKFLPIPQSEIEKTEGEFKLVQNPGY